MNRENKDEEPKDSESKKTDRQGPSAWSEGMPEMMRNCCGFMDRDSSASGASMMARWCKPMMTGCWWFALIFVALAGFAFALGYYLSPEVIQVLWMVSAGTIVVIGLFGLIMIRRMAANFGSNGCC